jgi:hypothetical protein
VLKVGPSDRAAREAFVLAEIDRLADGLGKPRRPVFIHERAATAQRLVG